MIYNFKYTNADKSEVLEYLEQKRFPRVLDVGATMSGWTSKYLTHYLDINQWEGSGHKGFLGNVCLYSTWKPVLEEVRREGRKIIIKEYK